MKVTLVIVPPGGGEADYNIWIDMPAVPAAGDYVSVKVPRQEGLVNLFVKRVWWGCEAADNGDHGMIEVGKEKYGVVDSISVECYPASGAFDSPEHKRTVDMYDKRGKGKIEFDNSMY